ncbi:MAG TPA: helix-turn-helix domain-containing protein [Pyrinomonadaceae bacterium]
MKRRMTGGSGDEKRQVVVINRPFVSPQQRCDRCTEPSGMITPDEAAALCEVSTRTVYRWLETGAIHFSEAVGEGLLICLSSLAATNISLSVRHSKSNSRM